MLKYGKSIKGGEDSMLKELLRISVLLLILSCNSLVTVNASEDISTLNAAISDFPSSKVEVTSEKFNVFIHDQEIKEIANKKAAITPAMENNDQFIIDKKTGEKHRLAKTQIPFESLQQWQRAEFWCWAASSQMVLNYYNIVVSQEMIVQSLWGQIIDRPAQDYEVTIELNNWIMPYGGQVIFIRGNPDLSILRNQIERNNPVIIGYKTGSGRHAVVITGIETQGNITYIIVRDPWPSQENINRNGRLIYPLDFLYNIDACWYITLPGLATGY